MAWRCFLTCWLMALAIVAAAQPKTSPILDVVHYDARVEPDIASKTVKGEVVLTFLITASGRTTIELDRGDLTIDSVREGGQAREYALHLLRQTLGETLFWSGIRDYTRANFGKSVTTADFQTAMEQVSGRNLSKFFSQWVYATTQ
jgi:aminopeptidase N